ncbi:MAG: polysaccharide biosynthesis C-terminal domain-containing protein, partial [Bacteroidota bacterium]|nr:polysaccharide biosynthesis C-terminal domain-containing protein [Bacteroidota bacterium]
LFWLALFQVFTYLLTYLRSNISALLLFKTDSILSVLDKSLTIIFCSILLWTNFLKTEFRVEYFVYVQVLSLFLTMIVALIIVLRKTGFVPLVWDTKFNILILKYGLPFAILSLLMAFYNKIDSVLLERLLDDNGIASGIYAAGFRLVDSANMVSYLFSVILLPLFAKLIKDKADIKGILKISSHLLLLVSVCFAIVSFLYSEELMSLLYNKNIEQSASVYRILCFCFIPISATYVFGTLLTANGSLKYLNIVAGFGMLINIVLNLLLIPNYREDGSAMASLTAQSITAILQIILVLRIFVIKFNWKYVLQLVFFVLCMLISCLLIYNISIGWITRILISGAMAIGLSFVFRVFDPKELLSFVSQSIKERK